MSSSRYSQTKTISFSKDNLDVYDLLQEQPNASRYICDAIRFYNQHKNHSFQPSLSELEIEKLIYNKLLELVNINEIAMSLENNTNGNAELSKNTDKANDELNDNDTPNVNELLAKNHKNILQFKSSTF